MLKKLQKQIPVRGTLILICYLFIKNIIYLGRIQCTSGCIFVSKLQKPDFIVNHSYFFYFVFMVFIEFLFKVVGIHVEMDTFFWNLGWYSLKVPMGYSLKERALAFNETTLVISLKPPISFNETPKVTFNETTQGFKKSDHFNVKPPTLNKKFNETIIQKKMNGFLLKLLF